MTRRRVGVVEVKRRRLAVERPQVANEAGPPALGRGFSAAFTDRRKLAEGVVATVVNSVSISWPCASTSATRPRARPRHMKDRIAVSMSASIAAARWACPSRHSSPIAAAVHGRAQT